MEIVAVDIGGTNARFAIAELVDGQVKSLGTPVVMKAAEHASLQTAWESYGEAAGRSLPRAAAIAVACPVTGDQLKLTNNPWILRPGDMRGELGLDEMAIVNDFGAVSYAVAHLAESDLRHVTGPDRPLPREGVISVIGPGTGLGVGQLLCRGGQHHVVQTEGGHIDWAPLDGLEDRILQRLRQRYVRVSAERLVSGPGLANIYEALAAIEGRPVVVGNELAIWQAAEDGTDSLATAAFDRFCLAFGAVTGDVALAQGATGVVLAGGVTPRIIDRLIGSGFGERFIAKGRFSGMMADIPVKLCVHPFPGLLGAAAAFADGVRR